MAKPFKGVVNVDVTDSRAEQDGWTVISVKNDWSTVFADSGG